MRVLALALLASCFSPAVTGSLPCEAPDNWCPPPMSCGAGGICGGAADGGIPNANLAFVSSDPLVLTGLTTDTQIIAAADTKCSELGKKLRPDGVFKAALGSPLTATAANIVARIDPIGGWVRPDGKPFAVSHDELAAGHLLYPMRLDDNGRDAGLQTFPLPSVITTFDASCTSIGVGMPDAVGTMWLHADAAACALQQLVYCFETGRTAPVAAPTFDPALRVGFLTDNLYSHSQGLAALDAHCQAEADAAQLGRTFKALVAANMASIRERFVPSAKPWTRLDGVVFAESDLKAFVAPLDLTPTGLHLATTAPTGATDLFSFSNSGNCGDWSSSTEQPAAGETQRSSSLAIYGGSSSCGMEHIYCLEAP